MRNKFLGTALVSAMLLQFDATMASEKLNNFSTIRNADKVQLFGQPLSTVWVVPRQEQKKLESLTREFRGADEEEIPGMLTDLKKEGIILLRELSGAIVPVAAGQDQRGALAELRAQKETLILQLQAATDRERALAARVAEAEQTLAAEREGFETGMASAREMEAMHYHFVDTVKRQMSTLADSLGITLTSIDPMNPGIWSELNAAAYKDRRSQTIDPRRHEEEEEKKSECISSASSPAASCPPPSSASNASFEQARDELYRIVQNLEENRRSRFDWTDTLAGELLSFGSELHDPNIVSTLDELESMKYKLREMIKGDDALSAIANDEKLFSD